MQTGTKFRFYPNSLQVQILLRWIGCQRFIYNAKVGEDRYFRAFARKSLQHAGQFAPVDQQYAQFKTDLSPWLAEVPSVILRNGAVKWKQAYSRFFTGLASRPNIQKKYGTQSVWITAEAFEFVPVVNTLTGEIAAHKLLVGTKKHPIGELAFTAHKAYRIPASIHIALDAGRWFVSFSHDDGVPEPKDNETAEWLSTFTEAELSARTFGGDRGVAIPLAGNNGERFDFGEAQKNRLAVHDRQARRWQRIQARRTKGSRRHAKAKRKVAHYKAYAKDVRWDFSHQVSHALAEDPQYLLYAFEALKVANMTASAKGTVEEPGKKVAQKSGLNRSILSSAWGQTATKLQYKARRKGKLYITVPPHHSSQECAACGHIHPDNRQTQSLFVCQRCGNQDNADRNAAIIIAKRGVLRILSGNWKQKEKKRCAISRIKVGTGSAEPVVSPSPAIGRKSSRQPTSGEITWVSREGGNVLTHGSVNRETPASAL